MMWVRFLQRVPGGMAELGLLQRSWKPSIVRAVPGFESQSLRQASEMMALCGIAGIGRQHWLRISGRKTLGFEPLIPHHYARLTQLGECYSYKVEAVGSSPTPSTKYERWIRKFGAIAQLGEYLIGGIGNNSFHLILHSLSILVICWITLKMLR